MSFTYSGSIDVQRGVCFVFPADAYVFKTTEECRIGIDGHPLIYVSSGEEFLTKQGAKYVFDRDTTVMIGYKPEQPVLEATLKQAQVHSVSEDINAEPSAGQNVTTELLVIPVANNITSASISGSLSLVNLKQNNSIVLYIIVNGSIVATQSLSDTSGARKIIAISKTMDISAGDIIKLTIFTSLDGAYEMPILLTANLQYSGTPG